MVEQLPLRLQLKASARFSNFIAGPNAELIGQLRQVASGHGEAFFFCWGSAGCGKTHLLQACCHQAASEGRTVAYVSLRDAAGLSPALLEGWEQFDLVCVDDLDAIAGDPDWEEALFHLYNRMRESGSALIVSAVAAPARLRIGLPDLLSRLGWGVVYQLKALDDTQRMQALQLRAQQKGCEMPDETASYLLRRLPRDMPALFDLLDQLDEASLAAQRKLTVPFVKSVLGL
ncbi:MAG: DnaA regulatory inactivator Hda [Gammaproteobacteria bacterium]|nr:MAG: DnaA regulatory inactivator Hda [Gammaproteobacteria bacterium]